MQAELIAAAAVHVLFAVFWAGSTFAVARTGGAMAGQLFGPQIGAATIAVFSGAYLWKLTHAGPFGRAEQLLALGAVCAVLAIGVQVALVGPHIRAVRADADNPGRARVAIAYRISAGLLGITILTMATARFV